MTIKLTLLGTGNPGCYPNRYQSAAALVAGETPIIIDCGGGAVQRIAMASADGQPALHLGNLKTLILTHLHPDHSAGLADFIVSTWIQERKEPLMIYGPAGTNEMVDHLIKAYKLGIAQHATHSPTRHPLKYEVIEYTDGELFSNSDVTATAYRVSHGQMETYALKFVMGDKSVFWSADTQPHPAVLEHGKGVDVMVHEVYSERGMHLKRERYTPVDYFRKMHTSTVELGEIANKTRPGRLILTHQMHLGPVTNDEVVQEITDLYSGEIIYGLDLDVFEI